MKKYRQVRISYIFQINLEYNKIHMHANMCLNHYLMIQKP